MTLPLRQASSVVLRRERDSRVYLVQRNPALRFLGAFWAFPGGAVSRLDREEARGMAGLPDDLAPFVFSAAREMFEEVGLLPFELFPDERLRLRQAVLEDENAFARFLHEGNRRIPTTDFHHLTRLITPDFYPIRFDTRFFLVDEDRCCGDLEPSILTGELVDGAWGEPRRWLARWRKGEILIAPPVILMLEILEKRGFEDAAGERTALGGGFEAAREELAALGEAYQRGRIEPILYNPAAQLLPLRTPTVPPATHTNAYLVGRNPAYLVDPASPYQEEQAKLDEAIEEAIMRGARPGAILLTHHHPDHVGGVEAARRRWKLPVWAHATCARLLEGEIAIDRTLVDGESLPLGVAPSGNKNWRLQCVLTEGHAAGHLCFFEEEYGSLLAGDMVSTLSSILVDPAEGDMATYMESLRRLIGLPVRMVLPAHGPGNPRGRELLEKQLSHRQEREASVLATIEAGASRIENIVKEVYEDIPESMLGYATLSARAIVDKLIDEGKVPPEGVS